MAGESSALLISGQDIIAAPASVIDDSPGAENSHQQAFNEAQGVLLSDLLNVDIGNIATGVWINSHMVFLNTPPEASLTSDIDVTWTFDGEVLGVMSDYGGTLEAASSSFLGAPGTIYPGLFIGRGMEGNDAYIVSGNQITVDMYTSEPGDWIRVITRSTENPVPEPATMLLFRAGIVGLAGFGRKKFKK